MASSGVLANAVINITANLTGLRHAMRETQTQLWGIMTMSARMGGIISQNILNPFLANRGIHTIAGAMEKGRANVRAAMSQWKSQKPRLGPRPPAPTAAHWLVNPVQAQQMAAAMAYWQRQKQRMPQRVAAWQANKPNSQSIMSADVHGATLAAGKAHLLAAAALYLGRKLKDAAFAASDFHEQLNKTIQVFGTASDYIVGQAKNLARFGVSSTSYLATASTIGTELMGSGMDEKNAAKYSALLTKRAIDLASLYQIPFDVAESKIISGLAGMSRPLKSLGIITSESMVEARALTMGLWQGKGELSEYAKMLARINLITEGSIRAADDYTNTLDTSLENQMKAFGGLTEELMKTIGSMGIFVDIMRATNYLIEATTSGLKHMNGYFSMLQDWIFPGWAKDRKKREKDLKEAADERNKKFREAALLDQQNSSRKQSGHIGGLEDFHRTLESAIYGGKHTQQAISQEQLNVLKDIQQKFNQAMARHDRNNIIGILGP